MLRRGTSSDPGTFHVPPQWMLSTTTPPCPCFWRLTARDCHALGLGFSSSQTGRKKESGVRVFGHPKPAESLGWRFLLLRWPSLHNYSPARTGQPHACHTGPGGGNGSVATLLELLVSLATYPDCKRFLYQELCKLASRRTFSVFTWCHSQVHKEMWTGIFTATLLIIGKSGNNLTVPLGGQ